MMISIICPIYNGLEHTKLCLKSLYVSLEGSSYLGHICIILVDDGSGDGTSEWISDNYTNIIVLKGDGNLWWSGAMNLGVQYALKHNSEYILLINNDNIFNKKYLDQIVNFAKESGIPIVGSVIMDIETNKIWSAGGFFDKRKIEFGMYNELIPNNQIYYKVDWLTGMGTLIHQSVFSKIGFWDAHNFPQYYGDTDFTLRATENKIDVCINKQCILWNNIKKSGINDHQGSFGKLAESLFSIRSHYNIFSFLRLMIIHKVDLWGMIRFFYKKHGKYVGGFIKHKLQKILRIQSFN